MEGQKLTEDWHRTCLKALVTVDRWKDMHDHNSQSEDTEMATTVVKAAPQIPLEDPLAYLPCSNVLEYGKGEIIYSHDQPHGDLYLVLTGMVKVTRVSNHGSQLLVDLYGTDDFFG